MERDLTTLVSEVVSSTVPTVFAVDGPVLSGNVQVQFSNR